jgi:hypothetical protein
MQDAARHPTRSRCHGSPSIEHKQAGQHACTETRRQPHECKPPSASTVRQIHTILSGTLGAAERWDWINAQRDCGDLGATSPWKPFAQARSDLCLSVEPGFGDQLVDLVVARTGSARRSRSRHHAVRRR